MSGEIGAGVDRARHLNAREKELIRRHTDEIVDIALGSRERRRLTVSQLSDDAVRAIAAAVKHSHHMGWIPDEVYRTRGRSIEHQMKHNGALRKKRQAIQNGHGWFKRVLHKIGHGLKKFGEGALKVVGKVANVPGVKQLLDVAAPEVMDNPLVQGGLKAAQRYAKKK